MMLTITWLINLATITQFEIHSLKCRHDLPTINSLKQRNIIEDKDSGEPRISHRIDLSTGIYNGRQILIKKETK